MFDDRRMLDLATHQPLSGTVAGLTGGLPGGHGRRPAIPLPVSPVLTTLLPGGLRRGSTVSVAGSVSLLLALLGAASAEGAWCALVGGPSISAEAAGGYGIELSRLAVVPQPGGGWATAVGALLDAVDIVVTRPPARVVPGDVRRLAARARTRDAVLMPFLTGDAAWPGTDVRLCVHEGEWSGIGGGYGRLRRRRVTVTAEGRGQAARPRSAQLWLPAAGGGVDAVDSNTAAVGGAPTIGPGALVSPATFDDTTALRAG
jgi:hypothetical protein